MSPGSHHDDQIHMLPHPLPTLLSSTLEDGEQVIWFAQPDFARVQCKAFYVLAMALTIIALVLLAAPWSRGGAYWLTIPFLLPAAAMLFLAWKSPAIVRSILYVVTSRRTLILSALKRDPVRAYPVRKLPQLLMRADVDGAGDLIFESESYKDYDGYDETREYGFKDIADVGLPHYILENLAQGKDPDLVRQHAAFWRQA